METSKPVARDPAPPVSSDARQLAQRPFEQALAHIVSAPTEDEASVGLADAIAAVVPVDALRIRPSDGTPIVSRSSHAESAQALDRLTSMRRRLTELELAGISLSVAQLSRQLWGLIARIEAPRTTLIVEVTGQHTPPDDRQLQAVFSAAVTLRERLRTLAAASERERYARIIANVAHAIHDLRSPVANSLGFLSLLKRALVEGSSEHRWTDIALEELRRLRGMLAGLLDVTRSEIGFDYIRPVLVDVAQLVRETANVMAEAAGREVRINAPATLNAEVDPTSMSKLVTNLLENAFKYSPVDSVVEITLESDDDRFRLAVRDQGAGIGPEDMTTIFEPFVRSENADMAQPGLGLGLSICRSIARNHGGRIFVQSELGHGSTFLVELPLRQGESTPEKGPTVASGGVQSGR